MKPIYSPNPRTYVRKCYCLAPVFSKATIFSCQNSWIGFYEGIAQERVECIEIIIR